MRGGLTREWYAGDTYDLRHVAYPPLVPLYEALLCLVRGGFDFDKLKPIFLVFYVSMLVSMYSALRASATPRLASVGTLMLALVPTLSTRTAAGAYADMPQAAMLAGVVAACLSPGDSALPWLIGGLTTVKAEGTILAVLACAGILLFWFLESPRGFPARVRREARNIAVVACLVGLRLAYVRWSGATDDVYGPLDGAHLGAAIRRIPHVARLCLKELASFHHWGLLWPAVLAAAIVLLVKGSAREKSLAIAVCFATIVLAGPFLFTSWPLDLHVYQAYFRLLAQISAAAMAVAALGYQRARSASTAAEPAPAKGWTGDLA